MTGIYEQVAVRLDGGRTESGDGVWKRLGALVDPGEYRPHLRDDIEIKIFRLKWGNDYAMIANPTDLLHYEIPVDDVDVLQMMDGTRTVKEIVVERFRESGDLELDDVVDLVKMLRTSNFLTDRYVDTTDIVRRAADPVSVGREKAREFVKTLQLEWKDAHRLVEWFYRHGVKYFFKPAVSIPAGVIAFLGFIAFIAIQQSGDFQLGGSHLAIQTILLLVMDYVLTFIHELGHAVVLVHYGRKVKSAGFMIYFGSPAFFVESSDGLMLDRGQRIVQSFAGPFAELVVSGIAAITLWLFPDMPFAQLLYTWALLNYFIVFLNMIPLLELDGYWILADVIQVPDLRPRSLQFIRHDLWRKLKDRERITKQEVGLALYGFIGVAFTIFSVFTAYVFWETVFGGLISELWDAGLVGRLFLAALILFLAGPIIRALISLARIAFRKVRALVDALRFRLQTKWRVEAAHTIDRSPMFDDLPEDLLSDLAGRVTLGRYPAGKPIFRQGDRPDAFYVVRTGTLHVVEEDPDTGKDRVLRMLGPGDVFGELGLVNGAPRSATVRPVVDSELFVIDESTFDRLLAGMITKQDVEPTLQMAAELRALRPFTSLASSDIGLLMEHGHWVNVAPHEAIIREGEQGDAFYAVGSGKLEVFRDEQLIGTLGPGSHFGEVALLMDVPRTATVLAKTPVRVFRIDREAFDKVIAAAFRRGTLAEHSTVGRTAQH
ncbi:MAG TPA: cyclic nucleotide-binding domain-containing protein [Actinomycetota bacterium]|nr:cyclic nucleotide-binding domain-containing protein [Actinomycetota bacterium]